MTGLVGGTGQVRVLMAVMRLHETYGRCTVRAVAASAGCAVATAHWHLRQLRREGLVTWEQGSDATLRPLVRQVAA